MRQVQRPLGILLYREMQGFHALGPRSILVGVALDLQACPAETVLGLKDGFVVDGDLDGFGSRVVEARAPGVGELEDGGELLAAPDVVGVERACRVRVEVRGSCVGRHEAAEHDWTLDLTRSALPSRAGRSRRGKKEAAEKR